MIVRHYIIAVIVWKLITIVTGNEEIVETGVTAKFRHSVEVEQDGQAVFEGTALLEVTRQDKDTLVIVALRDDGLAGRSLISDSGKIGLVVRTLGGRISSVLSSQFTSQADLNYLRSMASVLFVSEGSWSRSYEMVTDIFGTCESAVSRNSSATVVQRDLTRCSHSSIEIVYGMPPLPILHLAMDLTGSMSTCTYVWKENYKGILDHVLCLDQLDISRRFSDTSVSLKIKSSIMWHDVSSISPKFYDYIRKIKDSTDLIFSPVMEAGEPIEEKEVNEILRQLCLSSRDHLTKKSLWKAAAMLQALSRGKTSPDVLKYPCPTHIRRSVAYAAALVGGSRLLSFVHDEMESLVDEGEDLLHDISYPLITLAISNIAQPNLNPKMPTDDEFFNREENLQKLERVIELLLISGPEALPGVTSLLQKLRHLTPNVFRETLLKAAPVLSPEEACASGNAEEATRILHAVSSLTVRPTDFVASLRPCFATEDVGVQVAAMSSLGSLECQTPGVLELQQLALESPSDPEIRIAAFKGLSKCIPSHSVLLETLKVVLDPTVDNYSKQVASFVWSYLQSVLVTTNPNFLDLKLELEDDPDITSIPDPVYYDPRQHSRHLETTWILDPRTSVTASVDIVWGRASSSPRSFTVGVVLNHDGIPYNVGEVTVRVTGAELVVLDMTGFMEQLQTIRNYVEELWRTKRQVDQTAVKSFIDKVIERIPADYQANGSSIQLSINFLGLPFCHLHRKKFHHYLQNIPEMISHLAQSDFHSEFFHLMPFLDNGIEMGTSAGVPVTLYFHGTSGYQSLLSHYTDEGSGSIDVSLSGGLLLNFILRLGSNPVTDETMSLAKKGMSQGKTDRQISSIAVKYSWSFDLPLSFSYDIKNSESEWKFRRPVSLPHYVWQEEKISFINNKEFPVRYSENCVVREEPLHACVDVLEFKNLTGKLQILNNIIFQPKYLGLKLVVPSGGYGPITLLIKGQEKAEGRTITSYKVEIPADTQTIKYEADFVTYSALTSKSVILRLTTPLHKYFIKGFYTVPTLQMEQGSLGIEMSEDSSIYGLSIIINSSDEGRQKVVNPIVLMKTPEKGDEEVIKAKIIMKETSRQRVVEVSSSTEVPLNAIIEFRIVAQYTHLKKEGRYDFVLREMVVRIPQLEKVFISGQFGYTDTGVDSSLYITFGEATDIRITFSKGPTDLGPTSHILPPQVLESITGSKFAFTMSATHPKFPSPFSFGLSGSVKRGEVELDSSYGYGEDNGRILLFLGCESFSDLKIIISVENPYRDIVWAGSHEFTWKDNEYKLAFNVSWSQQLEDHAGFVFHLTKVADDFSEHSITLVLDFPQQEIEVDHKFSKALAGSYKQNIVLKMNPGRVVTMATVIVAGNDPNIITYGLSVDFKLDGWESSLRIVGTLNCMSSFTSCAVNVVMARGADQLMELEGKYTGSIVGISRTDIKLNIEPYLTLQSSADVVLKARTIKLRVVGDSAFWQCHFNGEVKVELTSDDFAEANFAILTSEDKSLIHYYNASVNLNKDSRTIFSRQELRVEINREAELWAATLQAKIGARILNEKHFIKAVFTTPYDTYYTINGEATSQLIPLSTIIGNIIVSVDIGPDLTYLLGWDISLQRTEAYNVSTEKNLLVFSTLGRFITPSLGESKLNIKAVRSTLLGTGKTLYSNTAEVRLVTETLPELGRLNARLEYGPDAFSFFGRIWSGSRSLAIESYGVTSNSSLKTSLSLVLTDPRRDWQTLKVLFEANHIGTFPRNFESSVESIVMLRHKNFGSVRSLAHWTPPSAAFSLAIASPFSQIPGGQIFVKWTLSSLQSRIAWSDLITYLDAKWKRMGKQIDFLFNFYYPHILISNVDSVFNLDIQEGKLWLYPDILIAKGRLTVGNRKHWIIDIYSKPHEKRFAAMGASIHPNGSSSFTVELAGDRTDATKDDFYFAKGALVLDASSHHVTVSYRSSSQKKDLTVLARTSLLQEANGYVFRTLLVHVPEVKLELDILLSEGSSPPTWSHMYSIRLEPTRTEDNLQEITARDFYVYRNNDVDAVSKQFFTLTMIHEGKESFIKMELPQLSGTPIVDGTISWPDKDDGEISSFFRLEVPDNNHILEVKLLSEPGKTPLVSLRRIIYRQKLIKGIGHPLRIELEISSWKGNEKNLRFSMQKLFSSAKRSKGVSQKGESSAKFYFKTFEGSLQFIRSPTSRDCKITWKTDDSVNEISVFLEQDHAGHGGHLSYSRNFINHLKTKSQMYLVKGNFRRFPSEVTCSLTFEQPSVGRPRSVTYLHSFAESYSELILDLAQSEEDQVIMLLLRNNKESSFRIGQLGNNFLHIASKTAGDQRSHQSSDQSHLLELASHIVELKTGHSDMGNKCRWGSATVAAPAMSPMHNSFTFCPQNNTEIKLQILGLEENEGPYLRVGQLSGPGGVGLQLGGGRLIPIDTPPALTITAGSKTEFFELLFDWQISSMNQLMEDIYARTKSVQRALRKLKNLKFEIKGNLALEGITEDVEQLLQEAVELVTQFSDEFISSVDTETIDAVRNFIEVTNKWLTKKRADLKKSVNSYYSYSHEIFVNISTGVATWAETKTKNAHEIFEFYVKDIKEIYKEINPHWIKISAGIRALQFNDNQSLYALTSRLMSYVHSMTGRHKGIAGFIVNDLLTRTEQIIARRLLWENVKSQLHSGVKSIEKVFPVKIIIFHDTAFRMQIHKPAGKWRKLSAELASVRTINIYKYFDDLMSLWKRTKARVAYLTTHHVKGSAALFNWEHAISWDGLFLSGLLSDTCPHMLVMLTKSSLPTAIVMHLADEENFIQRVLTFISGDNEITVYSDLKIKINGASSRMEKIDFGNLQLRKSENEVRIFSSDGLLLHCVSLGELCYIEVDKKNFAATAGLLGVFDFESNTDFMTSSWERPASESEWSNSWRIMLNDGCRSLPLPQQTSEKYQEGCTELFSGEDSPIRDCSRSVYAKPYEDACKMGKGCEAEVAYLKECHKRHRFEHLLPSSSCDGPLNVRLELTSGGPDTELLEGEEARLNCLTDNDSTVTRTDWYKDGKTLSMTTESKLEFIEDSLVVLDVGPLDSGVYQCKAYNSYGITASNTLHVHVMHKPTCAQDKQSLVLSEGSSTLLECRIKAYPEEVSFSWVFQNERDYVHIPDAGFVTSGLSSTLEYTPWSAVDFGTVYCLAENEIGRQTLACEFEIKPEGSQEKCEISSERRGTDDLQEEIIFVGEFSCIDNAEEFINTIKKQSTRSQKIILKYTNDGTPPENIQDFDIIASVTEPDLFRILESVVHKDFSKDSLKAIVLMDCQRTECKSQQSDEQVFALQEAMRNGGIHLYTVTEDAISILNPESVSNKVKKQLLGLDRKTAYLISHARKKNVKGKKSIRRFLDLPQENVCASLALQSDGALFSLKKVKKNYHRKVLQQLIGLRVLQGFQAKYLKCRKCPCDDTPCTLCKPPRPYETEGDEEPVEDQEEEYDDEIELR